MRRFDVARVLGEAAALLLFAASAIAYPLWGRRVLIAAVGFGLAGSVLGLVPAVIVVGPHTTPDLVYHLLLVTALTVGLYPAVTGRKTQRDRSWCVSR